MFAPVAVPADFSAQLQAFSNALENAYAPMRRVQAAVSRKYRRTRRCAHQLQLTELRKADTPTELTPVLSAEVSRCTRDHVRDPHTQLHDAPVLSLCHASRPPCQVFADHRRRQLRTSP